MIQPNIRGRDCWYGRGLARVTSAAIPCHKPGNVDPESHRRFSTTSEFLSQAHFHKRATFIGEESGGGYYGNSSGMMPLLTLPNTKLSIRVPLVTYYMAVSGYKQASHGVVPDYRTEYTIAELLAGVDKEMELALKQARKQ